MKTVILALFVLLAVSQSDALKCICGGLKRCPHSVETCYGTDMVCASVIIEVGSTPNYFQGCMKSRDCSLMNRPGTSSSTCCSTDQCNR